MLLAMVPVLSFVLIALGIGFLVCVKAKKEAGMLKPIGYAVGVLVIAISLVSLINIAFTMFNMRRQGAMSMMNSPQGTMARGERRMMPRAAMQNQQPPAKQPAAVEASQAKK